jgi:hypothetical protein
MDNVCIMTQNKNVLIQSNVAKTQPQLFLKLAKRLYSFFFFLEEEFVARMSPILRTAVGVGGERSQTLECLRE